MPRKLPNPATQHPDDEFERDLHPSPFAGQNVGIASPRPELDAPTAFDVKDVHRRLSEFRDDELQQIPILPTGSRLEQGATYVNLRDLDGGEFKAMGYQEAERGHWYVPKDAVPYELWNRLIGVDNPERTGTQTDPR
jgi:hypothetical protein